MSSTWLKPIILAIPWSTVIITDKSTQACVSFLKSDTVIKKLLNLSIFKGTDFLRVESFHIFLKSLVIDYLLFNTESKSIIIW